MLRISLGVFSEMKIDECHPVKGMKYECRYLELNVFGGYNICLWRYGISFYVQKIRFSVFS
jgi:hypothetical protein